MTTSKLGEIKNRRFATAPDRLISDIFQYNKNKSAAPQQCLEGLNLEQIIREKYLAMQLENGHTGIKVTEKELVIDKQNPLLVASIDGEVYDPTGKHSLIENLEIKYKQFSSKLHTEQNLKRFYYTLQLDILCTY